MALYNPKWNAQLFACTNKGYQAAKEGKSRDDHPYIVNSWSTGTGARNLRAQRVKAWEEGWDLYHEEQKDGKA